MPGSLLNKINSMYSLTELPAGEYATMKVAGITFNVRHFRAEGLGHVSLMRGSGMFGLMKMDTLVINPFEVDAPLFSYDRIHALGNDTLLLEIYETRLDRTPTDAMKAVTERYRDLPDADPGVHWYECIRWKESVKKKGKKAETPAFDRMTQEYLAAFLGLCAASPKCSEALKRSAASEYSEGLLAHGGPSTDAFLKTFGKEKTGEFFRGIMFGA